MSKLRDKKKKQRVSAAQRATTHNVGRDFASMTIPKDVNLIRIKEDCKKRWSIVPFIATSKNPLASKYDRVGELYFERTFWVHPNMGPNNDSYACPARNTAHLPAKKRLRCPICEERARLARGSDVDEELLKSLLTKERQLWLIYDHDDTEKGVQLYEASYHGLGKSLDEAVRSDMDEEEPEGYESFADPESGHILRISFKGQATGGTNKWYPPARIDFKERTKPLPDEIIEHGIDVDAIVKLVPFDDLAALFMQETDEDDDDDDDDDDDRPVKKKKRPADDDDDDDLPPKKKKRPVEDDDDDEPAPKKKKKRPVEDDDDDEPAPKKKKKRPVVDDDDDDDDD